jgi:hypothetical protein
MIKKRSFDPSDFGEEPLSLFAQTVKFE